MVVRSDSRTKGGRVGVDIHTAELKRHPYVVAILAQAVCKFIFGTTTAESRLKMA